MLHSTHRSHLMMIVSVSVCAAGCVDNEREICQTADHIINTAAASPDAVQFMTLDANTHTRENSALHISTVGLPDLLADMHVCRMCHMTCLHVI